MLKTEQFSQMSVPIKVNLDLFRLLKCRYKVSGRPIKSFIKLLVIKPCFSLSSPRNKASE